MYNLENLNGLVGNLVRGRYDVVVGGGQADANVVYRDGVAFDAIQGFVDAVRVTKAGKVILVMRNMNRITPGDRSEVTDTRLLLAELDPRVYKGLAGEYKFRSYRSEGLRNLEVCRGGKWTEVDHAQPEA